VRFNLLQVIDVTRDVAPGLRVLGGPAEAARGGTVG
jgi:hypothetical protein